MDPIVDEVLAVVEVLAEVTAFKVEVEEEKEIILTNEEKPYNLKKITNKIMIIIINKKKKFDKFYRNHSGQVGGMRLETFNELQQRVPGRVIEKSIKGMLPKGPLGRQLFTKLKVYKGSEHPHNAQQPTIVNI